MQQRPVYIHIQQREQSKKFILHRKSQLVSANLVGLISSKVVWWCHSRHVKLKNISKLKSHCLDTVHRNMETSVGLELSSKSDVGTAIGRS